MAFVFIGSACIPCLSMMEPNIRISILAIESYASLLEIV